MMTPAIITVDATLRCRYIQTTFMYRSQLCLW